MNKDRIASLLKEPARVAREDLAGLRELTERHPWFSGAHLLLAMGENASGEVLFDETLKTTAAHVPSREVLFNEVERRKGKEESGAASHEPRATNLGAGQLEARGSKLEALPGSHDDLAQRILDQQILEAAATGAYALQQRDRSDDRLIDRSIDQPTSGSRLVGISQLPGPGLSGSASEEIRPATETPPPSSSSQPSTSPRPFTHWLDSAAVEMVTSVPFDNEAAMAGSAQDRLRQPAGVTTREEVPFSPPKAPSTPELTRDLIDRFLQQTSPQPRKADFFDPQQAGKRSLEEHLDIVTETLARIHEKQGHWAKAAAAYHRLATEHPEKSGYFAALAKNAQQQLNK